MKSPKKKRFNREAQTIIDQNNLIVERYDTHYYFICPAIDLHTHNIAEAVAALMKFPKYASISSLWKIPYKYEDSDNSAILYWLSGGRDSWSEIQWKDVADIYCNHFSEKLDLELRCCNNMKDIRDMFYNQFSTINMIEFAMKHKLIEFDKV